MGEINQAYEVLSNEGNLSLLLRLELRTRFDNGDDPNVRNFLNDFIGSRVKHVWRRKSIWRIWWIPISIYSRWRRWKWTAILFSILKNVLANNRIHQKLR